jgi:copper transport protein
MNDLAGSIQFTATGSRRGRRTLVSVLLLAVAVATLLVGTGTALAHAELVKSDPPNGGLVAGMPAQVSLQYSEGVATLSVWVTDAGGQHYESGLPTIKADDHSSATVLLKTGGNGIYTVTWNALSEDGHTTGGSFFFIVGDKLPDRTSLLALYQSAAPSNGPGANVFEAVARFVMFVSLLVLAGLPLAVASIGSELVRQDAGWRIVRRTLVLAAITFMASATALAIKQILSGYSLSLHDINAYVGTSQGSAWMARWELATVAGFGAAFIRRRWLVLILSALTAAGGQLSLSIVSHSGTLVGGFGAVFIDFTHLLFGGIWGGGLILLAVVLPLAYRDPASVKGRTLIAAVGRRFSGMAILGAGLATAAGLMLAAWHVGTWHEFVSSLYGLSLLAKIALLVLALGLGAAHRLFLVRRMEEGLPGAVSTFRRSVRVEALAVVGILALSAVLTSAQTGAATAAISRQGPVHLSQTVLGTEVRLVATPGKPGLNVFDATFLRNGKPTDEIDSATLLLSLPDQGVQLDEIPLERTGPGEYSAVAALVQPGAWYARVAADVTGQFTASRFSLPDSTQAGAYLSDRGMALVLHLLAATVAFATICGLIGESVMGEKVGRASHVAES